MSEHITLGYYGLRGIAEPIRFLLHYKGVQFEDKRYADFNEWMEDKFNLGLDFPNLPYLIDGEVKMTQSVAILRYLARKYHLDGETEQEKQQLAMIEQQLLDFRLALRNLFYGDNFETAKPGFIEKVPPQLKLFQTFLGDKTYLTGDKITYVDFMAYEVFDFYRLFIPNICDDFPSLRKYHQRIINLPELQNYLNSSTYKRWPIMGPLANFGGSGEYPKYA